MGFKHYIDLKEKNIEMLKVSDNIISKIIDPAIKYSKRLKSKTLKLVERNNTRFLGPGIIVHCNESSQINTENNLKLTEGLIVIPIDMFTLSENGSQVKHLDDSDNFSFIVEDYMLVNIHQIFDYAVLSKLNKFKSIDEIKTYSDLVDIMYTYKNYYIYKGI